MLAVIIDLNVKEICEYTGLSSCLQLKIPGQTLLSYITSELKYAGVNDVIVYSKYYTECTENITLCKTLDSLQICLRKHKNENMFLVYSDGYFEFDSKKIKESAECLLSFNVTDCNNGYVCSYMSVCDFTTEYEAFADAEGRELLASDSSKGRICCAEQYKRLSGIKDYKVLCNDVLNLKTSISLPEVAEGVYVDSAVPKGDFVIVPPVYFGENVQIESGCIIGPGTVIGDNTLVSKKSCVKNSLIMKDCFISSGCFTDNIICCPNVSVRRNTAVFSGSVLGHDCTVGEGMCIENQSLIRPYTKVSDYKNSYINYKLSDNDSPAGFYGYTPEKASVLGGVLGSVYQEKRVGILCNGEINAQILRFSLLSGFMSAGVKCYDFGFGFQSQLLFFINFCELDYGIYIDGNDNGTFISFIDKNGENIPKDDFYYIKEKLLKKEVKMCKKSHCGTVDNVHGMKKIYTGILIKNIEGTLPVFPVFLCDENHINSVIESALKRVEIDDLSEKIIFRINKFGTWCEAEIKGKIYTRKRLCDFLSFYKEPTLSCNEIIREYDAVFLCFELLETVQKNKLDLSVEIENIPSFYLAERVVDFSENIPFAATHLSDYSELSYYADELIMDKGEMKLKFFKNKNISKLKLLAKSVKVENAEEITNDFERILKYLNIRTEDLT